MVNVCLQGHVVMAAFTFIDNSLRTFNCMYVRCATSAFMSVTHLCSHPHPDEDSGHCLHPRRSPPASVPFPNPPELILALLLYCGRLPHALVGMSFTGHAPLCSLAHRMVLRCILTLHHL